MNKKKQSIVPTALLERLSMPSAVSEADQQVARQELEELLATPTELQLTSDLRFILSRPSFGCQATAQVLRRLGRDVEERAEDEQAATIHWMLNHYLRDPLNWRNNSLEEFNAAAASLKTTDS
jgi:hypothetical protein